MSLPRGRAEIQQCCRRDFIILLMVCVQIQINLAYRNISASQDSVDVVFNPISGLM